jgi:hypothetical protein
LPSIAIAEPQPDRGNCMVSRQRDELFAPVNEECIGRNAKAESGLPQADALP